MTPEQIAHYRVDRLIGSGGMGEVYLAEDTRLHRSVALKLLPERFMEDPERVRRFQREARAVSALNHPNILTIHDIGESQRRHYIATEYIEGRTLRDRISLDPPMALGEILDVSIAVAGALGAAHDAGIIHRDIKPENIMLRRDGLVKVLDFGLAKLVDSASPLGDSSTGAVMGTLLYISPEQARGITPDARSDLYSLGAVMYEMLTRKPPIVTESFVELAMAIASREPTPPSAVARGIPPELDRIILKALAKDRNRRYQSAQEMLQDLRTLRRELEFEDKLSDSGAYYSQPTAILGLRTHTSSVFARLSSRFRHSRAAAVLLIAASAALVVYAVVKNGASARNAIESVAVLPFENTSGDPEAEYLSDGIAVSILDSLSQLPGLQVTASSVVLHYKGKKADPLSVGRELGVRAVVTGELRQRGETLVISARMTDVRRKTQIWGEQYTREVADVLELQREMSRQISEELRVRLTGEERQRLTRHSTTNNEAFRLFLKARHHRDKYSEVDRRRAIDYFRQSIELDPSYALAYAGLADAYHGVSNVWMRPSEAMPRAREAARRALEIDESLSEAHSALALVYAWYDWDFDAGEREFRRAIELNPNDNKARRLYGDFLIALGQFDRALQEKKTAEQIDPLSVPASLDVARALFFAGRLDEAEEQLARTEELDDRLVHLYTMRAEIALLEGRGDDARAFVEKAIAVGGRTPFTVALWGYVHGRLGDREKAMKALKELESWESYLLPLFLARVHAAIGEKEKAIDHLEKLYPERSESLVWMKVDTTFASLRDHPRFQELVRRVGL